MDNIAAVTKGDTLDHLVDIVPESLGVDANCVFLEYFKQVLLNVFKDEVKSSLSTQNK